MGHSLYNRIQTKPAMSARRMRALALIASFTTIALVWLGLHLVK